MQVHIPATIISLEPFVLSIENESQSCAHCAESGGCGQDEAPWFRARLPNRITLPAALAPKRLVVPQKIQLILDSRALTQAAWLSYGVPLLGFFTGLGVVQSALGSGAEGWQLGGGLVGIGLSAWLTKRFEAYWIRRHLHLATHLPFTTPQRAMS